MILAKPYTLAVGGSRYDVPGCKFFLLAASEPLNISLYSGTEKVAEIDGMQGGMKAGPFCPALSGFIAVTQSGAAGSALIGVGDEDMDYNPLAGALNFTNSNTSAVAAPIAAGLPAAQSSQNGQNFSVIGNGAAVASAYSGISLSSSGVAATKTATVTGARLTNKSAAAVVVFLGVKASQVSAGGNLLTPTNRQLGGPASAFAVSAGTAADHSGIVSILSQVQVDANGFMDVDLSTSPVVLQKGAVGDFLMQALTADVEVDFEILWTES